MPITMRKSSIKYKNSNGKMEELGLPLGVYETDSSLTRPGIPADAKATGDEIKQIKEDTNKLSDAMNNLPSGGSGLTTNLKTAMKTYFTDIQCLLPQLAYVTESNDASKLITDAQAVVKALDSIGDIPDVPVIPDEPDEPINPDKPEITLSSISANYYGGDVNVGTSLADLTGIVVIATYSDGSTANVTGYTLNGTIGEGSNTITVSYGGKTTTFTVTGVAESGGETTGVSNETTWTDGVAYTYTTISGECLSDDMNSGEIQQYGSWSRTPYLYCDGASKLRFVTAVVTSALGNGKNNKYCAFYDKDKNFIQRFGCDGIDNNTVGAYVDRDIPENAVYFIASHKNEVISTPYLRYIPYA